MVTAATVSATATAAATGMSLQMLPWDLARAGGITAYLLMATAILLGIIESTPRLGRARPVREVTHHYHRWVMLFALVFVVVHTLSLVLDPYAGVSLAAVFIPGLSQYRPLAVSLGTLALLSGVLMGATAWLPRRFPRIWLPMHRFAVVVFALAWAHGVTAGTDTPRLLGMYAVTGLLPLGAAVVRYLIVRAGRRTQSAAAGVRN